LTSIVLVFTLLSIMLTLWLRPLWCQFDANHQLSHHIEDAMLLSST